MGIMGLAHCVAMCGSLSMALGFSIPANKSFVRYATFISIGRIFGYALIGIAANFFAQSIITLTNGHVLYLSIFSSLLMIGIGLHIANITNFVLKLEKIGAIVNPFINPIKKRLLPIDSILKCLLYGMFWGFLPCGLIYTALSLALVAPTPVMGGLVMLSFGIGTLPALIGMTLFNSKLNSVLSNKIVRLGFGITIIVLAILQLLITLEKITNLV